VASGEILAFVDADTDARPGWAAGMARGFAEEVDLVAGGLLRPRPRTLAEWYLRGKREHDRRGMNGFLPFAAGACIAVRRGVFEELGGFDADLPAAEDLDFCFRAQLAGHRLGIAPEAMLVHLARSSVRGMLSQQVRNARGRRVADHKFEAFPFERMDRTRRRASGVLLRSGSRQLLTGIDGDHRRLALPFLDASLHAARRTGMRLGGLELLTGLRATPPAIQPASSAQRMTSTPLPEGPSLLVVGDDRRLAALLGLTIEWEFGISTPPAGLEREVLAGWDDPAPWSLRLARGARREGWAVPVDLLARRVERERPRTFGEAYVALHAAYAWLRGQRRFAITAPGGAGERLAERLPDVPLVVAGRYEGEHRRVLAAVRRGDILRSRREAMTRLSEALRGLPEPEPAARRGFEP
jgi:hypothetical protein